VTLTNNNLKLDDNLDTMYIPINYEIHQSINKVNKSRNLDNDGSDHFLHQVL
jgi:hypothetical protein